eukprot:3880881-Pyramimonas_sp.AAC.1
MVFLSSTIFLCWQAPVALAGYCCVFAPWCSQAIALLAPQGNNFITKRATYRHIKKRNPVDQLINNHERKRTGY